MEKNLNGNLAENLNGLFNEVDHAVAHALGTTSAIKGKKQLIYASEAFSHTLTESCDLWIRAYAVFSNRKNTDGRYNFKDFIFEITTSDETEVLFSSCSSTEAFSFISQELVKIEDDAEWENLLDESQKMTESTKEFENEVEDLAAQIDSYMDETESLMDEVDENGETGWQKNAISENMNRIYNLLTDMFNEKNRWLADLSRITGCNMTPWDVYSDDYFIDLGHGIELDIFNANITDFFEDLLNTLFERYEDHENQDLASKMLDLRDTLYHYLAVA